MSTAHQNLSIHDLQNALEHFAEALREMIENATDECERCRMILSASIVRDAISVLERPLSGAQPIDRTISGNHGSLRSYSD